MQSAEVANPRPSRLSRVHFQPFVEGFVATVFSKADGNHYNKQPFEHTICIV